MSTPKSPTLGRPLSFPHPNQVHPEDLQVDSDVLRDEDNKAPRPTSTNQFTSMPVRDESGSLRETEDNHSLANTFGTADLLQRGKDVGHGDMVRSKSEGMAPNHPNGGDIMNYPAETEDTSQGGSVPVEDSTQSEDHLKSHQYPAVVISDPHPHERKSSSSETMHHRSSSSSGPRDQSGLNDPSDERLKEAGILAASAAGAGTAARHLIVSRDGTVGQEGGREPIGYRNVDVPSKWGFTSSNIKEARTKALKKAVMLLAFITLWLWICLSIFWGSTYRLTSFMPSLTVHVIPFDTPTSTSYLNGPITQQMTYVANEPPSIVHLGYQIKDPSNYPDGLNDVRRSVIAQECWAAIVVNANASSAWTNALQNGDASYDPSGAIGIYYSSARFYQVVLLYFDSLITRDLANPLASARSAALKAFMGSSATNTALLTNAARAPQAIGVGFGYTIFDVRPIQNYAWAGAAPMEASLIYFIIFAFYLCLFGGMARMKSGLNTRLKMSSMFAIRLGWPLLAYFFISLWETLIIRAWQIPLTNHLGRAGFVTLWALNYVTIIAAGFAMETVLALVGLSWLPFFLILWIIPSSFYPIEMMPNFYRFLRWMPFLHNVEAYKIIAFGTNLQHRLGLHFGVLFAVIGVELVCLPLALIFERWSTDKSKRQEIEQQEKEKQEKKKNGENDQQDA
ncbi:uncharacterized protein L201_007352 [Kwoniella dendrophila CBS 6074]|uniref:DUF3533 domain-containing protein n=1 Tax=Kwoniella dendrophila CBS 6074 TaxID=1295534 RepID=A0AAX4K458_9TREE